MRDRQLIDELEKWSKEYGFSFQFWGPDLNNVYISKGDIEIANFGGEANIRDIIVPALEWVKKQNPKGVVHSEEEIHRCSSCGCRIAIGNDICGECACEDDSYF